jgi:hypothetical protein
VRQLDSALFEAFLDAEQSALHQPGESARVSPRLPQHPPGAFFGDVFAKATLRDQFALIPGWIDKGHGARPNLIRAGAAERWQRTLGCRRVCWSRQGEDDDHNHEQAH